MSDIITNNQPKITFDLIPQGADKDTVSRLGRFVDWCGTNNQVIHEPDLSAYRDHLLGELAPSSVAAHLGTIRGRYDRIVQSNQYRDAVEVAIVEALERSGQTYGIADREAAVNRIIERTRNAINPRLSEVKISTRQDTADSQHRRLTTRQASSLLAAPGLDTLRGLRDTSLIALMLATGIRAAEAAAVDVRDLRQSLGGELALHVREGKGRKERLIPYGPMDWVLVVIDFWLSFAGIESGPVFRGFYQGYTVTRETSLTTRAVGMILKDYPIPINGEMATVAPHDLRRTYARLQYESGVDPMGIQQNLGHEDLKTTQGYIGTLDASARRPAAVIELDLSALQRKG